MFQSYSKTYCLGKNSKVFDHTAQFNYCPLIWMRHSRNLNNKIKRIQERALRIVYNDYKSNFKELLERDHSFTIHKRNIHYLAVEAYKVKNGLSLLLL